MATPNLPLQTYLPNVSPLAYGCMGLGGGWDQNPVSSTDVQQAQAVVETALDCGINLFDHADIYTFSKAEQAFGKLLSGAPELREQIYIQSKCGIRFADDIGVKRYDFSAQWIEQAVEQSLQRLNCGYLDILLLHRPDPLMELDEVARTLQKLQHSGKVNQFGVSNMNPHQIRFLQSALDMPIIINQLELSLAKNSFVTNGMGANPELPDAAEFDNASLLYCQAESIQVQAWGALAQGRFNPIGQPHSDQPQIQQTRQLVSALAEKYQVSSEAVVLGFLTRHPAKIQPVVGTTNLARIRACSQVTQLQLSREDWYGLLEASRGEAVP